MQQIRVLKAKTWWIDAAEFKCDVSCMFDDR